MDKSMERVPGLCSTFPTEEVQCWLRRKSLIITRVQVWILLTVQGYLYLLAIVMRKWRYKLQVKLLSSYKLHVLQNGHKTIVLQLDQH